MIKPGLYKAEPGFGNTAFWYLLGKDWFVWASGTTHWKRVDVVSWGQSMNDMPSIVVRLVYHETFSDFLGNREDVCWVGLVSSCRLEFLVLTGKGFKKPK